MNFRKLSKEKRQQLVLVVIVTLVAVNGLGFGLIRSQYQTLKQLAVVKVTTDKKLSDMQNSVKNASRLEAELSDARKALAEAESDVVSGDLFSWVNNALRQFKTGYKVEILQFSPPSPVTDVTMLPGFPYKQAMLTITGTGRFHDVGRFLADFENHFPHMRLLNLILEPNPSAAAEDQETLSFKLDLVTLMKSGSQ